MNTSFEGLNGLFWKQFERGREMAFATCAGTLVTNRIIVVVSHKERLYMITGTDSKKYAQMQKNPQVGLCAGMLQMTGLARSLGHTLDAANKELATAYEAVFKEYFDEFAGMPENVLVEIMPQTAVVYTDDNDYTTGYTLDFGAQTASKI